MREMQYKVKFNGMIFTGAQPYASYSGPDKFRGTVQFHSTREAAQNRAARTVIGSWKVAIPVGRV